MTYEFYCLNCLFLDDVIVVHAVANGGKKKVRIKSRKLALVANGF